MPKSITTTHQYTIHKALPPLLLLLSTIIALTTAIILDKSTGFDGANIPLAIPPSGPIPLPAAVAASSVSSLAAAKAKAAPCKITEYKCDNRRCVPLTSYCDNKNDCGDSSDEPRYCTRCNRTYYGEVGITYDLELHRPKEDRIPFICYLTFKAAGSNFGDLVQLTFDSFTLGRFVSFTSDGCPDGYLQIIEAERPHVGGSWCGTSWGPSIYYSETESVTITVSLLRLSKDQNGYNFDFRMEYKLLSKGDATVRYGGGTPFNPIYEIKQSSSSNYNFFNTTPPTYSYNQLNQPRSEPEYYLGDLITGTYCSRIFSDCDRRRCRLQSPNFPGVYPRNLTCYYAVRQHEVPPDKHALITVRQTKGQLISIRSQAALYGTVSTRELKVWNACDDVQDYVTVYDGYTTRDPVILKFCGGGEAVPEAVSSGHELLVEFSTSPYGTFLHPTPAQSLHGFQLEVEVRFVDLQSPTFVKNKRNCEFWIRGTGRGILESPLHSIPANTSCLYHLQGMDTNPNIPHAASGPLPSSRYPPTYWRTSALVFPPARYRVWLSVVKFHVTPDGDELSRMMNLGVVAKDKGQHAGGGVCRSYLNVWDGQLWSPTNCNDVFCTKERYSNRVSGLGRTGAGGSSGGSGKNVSMLARYCREHVPRTCDHILLANATRRTRPCTLAESFLSSGDSLTLEFRLSDSTALRPVRFRTLYEFVDLHLDGEAYGDRPCRRRFSQSQDTAQKFHSPRDVFLFGRGGARNISCVYRFEAQPGEHVKLILSRVSMLTNRQRCKTLLNPLLSQLNCEGNAAAASMRIYDVPWKEAPAYMRDCICGIPDKHLPYTYVSTSNVVEIRFDARDMDAGDDYGNLNFEGTWQFVKMPSCAGPGMRKMGASGEVGFVYPSENANEVVCEKHARAVVPQTPHKYLYVKTPGVILSQYSTVTGNRTRYSISSCTTKNRISIHTQLYTTYVCPYYRYSYKHLVEVFSDGWVRAKGGGPAVEEQGIDYLGGELSRGVTVTFHVQEAGSYGIGWLELAHRKEIPHIEITTSDHRPASTNGQSLGDDLLLHMQSTAECQYRCPELDACVNGSVWCDGVQDCPSGVDESITNCSLLLQLPPLYLFLTSVGMLVSAGVTCLLLYRGCVRPRLRRHRSFLQSRLHLSISSSTDTAILDEKSAAVIC